MKGILFDMDGVLVDSEPLITAAAIKTLNGYGIKPAEEDFKPFTGTGEERFIGGVAEKYGLKFERAMMDMAYDIYDETAPGNLKVFDGAAEVIRAVRRAGFKTAVCSSSHRRKVLVNIREIGVGVSDFDAVITGSEVDKKKPDPEIFLKGAAALGISPRECIVIEDALSGIAAALAAGSVCVAVPTSFTPEKLKKAGARAVVGRLADFPAAALKLRG